MLELINIEKKHGSQTTLQKLSLRIEEGEFFSLLGPSGCGKTTLLRILSGFETPTSGEIHFCGKRIDHLAPQDRPFNIVFQSYALFPHLTVYENIAFGLRIKITGKDKEEIIRKKVTDILETIGLEELGDRLPETLSGGQAQRVALARALVNEPKLLLLDEPLSALDAKMRESMQRELRALQQRLGITFIFVTHDQEEALTLSDRVAVMNKGVIEQMSSPRDLYENPKSCFVARFMGSNNELCGEIIHQPSNRDGSDSRVQLKVEGGPTIWANSANFVPSLESANKAVAFIRPERIRIYSQLEVMADQNRIKGVITNIIFRGQHNEIQVDCDDLGVFKLVTKPEQGIELGADVYIGFDANDTMIFRIDE